MTKKQYYHLYRYHQGLHIKKCLHNTKQVLSYGVADRPFDVKMVNTLTVALIYLSVSERFLREVKYL